MRFGYTTSELIPFYRTVGAMHDLELLGLLAYESSTCMLALGNLGSEV